MGIDPHKATHTAVAIRAGSVRTRSRAAKVAPARYVVVVEVSEQTRHRIRRAGQPRTASPATLCRHSAADHTGAPSGTRRIRARRGRSSSRTPPAEPVAYRLAERLY